MLLGFAAELRRSELVAVQREHITVTPEGLRLLIPRAKTDQQGRGAELGIPRGKKPETCPVRALEAWLQASDCRYGPVFRKIDRWGTIEAAALRGRWAYLYRAIDRDGNLVDTRLSEHRDMAAAQAFFRSAKAATGITPERVTTDGHGSYPRAIRATLGRRVVHRTSAFKNNGLEQDHRGVKGRTRCMRGFKSLPSAARFCRGYDELRNFLRPCTRRNQYVSARRRRLLHLRRATSVLAILEAA
ncbi:DDE-type integrase/transposase/recombinase [Paracraurococcus lichenis]|uniref:DDE-type integrase/transposase/recombinase n=1 Tax=Paracraurococcus lichenis TaxID=3064888 RepID=A0ABT9EA82_9PROT|nr:DDE-type integrase/transposase/recombinase [Paracraurococcus sp. LOR1-02]MDO9713106.1 DDE-type integrase/transposase/recombinase [Paracraurococcus sp. LOR1-02]